MGYMDNLQSGLGSMVEAGETGRKNVEGMLSPVSQAVYSMTDAADALEGLPFVGPAIGARLGRVMGAIQNAQARVNQVMATASRVSQGVTKVKDMAGKLEGQVARAKTAASSLMAKSSPAPVAVVPTAALATPTAPPAQAVTAYPHLLIAQPMDPKQQAYHFGLDTAAFETLSRSTAWRWASQERLGRRPAQQAVGMGEDKISLKGVIFPGFKGGLKQLDAIRTIGDRMQPLLLTSGYGEVLGTWCLASVNEDREALMQGGIPRKQGFNLEFVRYGDDM